MNASRLVYLETRCQELMTELLRLQYAKIPDEAFERERFEWEDINTQKKFGEALDRIQKMRRISVVKPNSDRCGSCGKNIIKEYKYCPHCGTKLYYTNA